KRLASKDAALISLAVYLFLPFGVIASRSFQPEALMAAGMVWSLVCFIRWLDEHSIKNAIVAGIVTGLTILVKPNPLFMLLPVYLLLLISQGLLKALKNVQVWIIAGLSAVFSMGYYLFVNPNAGGFLNNFWQTLITVVPTSKYALGWGSIILDIIPFTILIIALASTLLYPKLARWVPIGLWVGYVVYGIFVPYHIYTHNYYSIVLVPITAIALGQVGEIVAKAVSEKKLMIKAALILVGVIAIGYSSWNVYKDLTAKNYRGEPAGWALVGEAVPEDLKVIALTHNYGYNLAYYGYRMVDLWPYAGELDTAHKVNGVTYQNFETYYEAVESTYDLFLVTNFSDLNGQPQLKEALSQLPIYSEGDGFVIYDLRGSGEN
ncbi:MAG: glycosyltransferase family 39 protein, partial [Anaerolineaceae bacterium]|nr:glycosyltransferase family 39 protein [Anaerolineaceae bacterium]